MVQSEINEKDTRKNKGINALYYPETICLDEIELKYLLLLYDKVFFLPIDNQLNPGHTSLSKRFSMHDAILTGAFKTQRDAHYALMYSSEPHIWDDRMKRLMGLYDELEEKGIVVGLQDEEFAKPNKCHPLSEAVEADMKDSLFVSTCQSHKNDKVFVPRIDDSKIKGGGLAIRPFEYKGDLGIFSICSQRMNTALFIAGRENLFPVCDSSMYVELLTTKLKRVNTAPSEYKIPPDSIHRFSLLSWEIATEIVPRNLIAEKSTKDLLQYKTACIDLKQKFRSYLWRLEASISSDLWDTAFPKELDRIVKREILPEVQRIQEQKIVIWEKLFGQTLKSLASLKIAPALIGIQLVAGLSFLEILALGASVVGGVTLNQLIDAWQDERSLRRNALFFLVRFKQPYK